MTILTLFPAFFLIRQLLDNDLECSACRNRWIQDVITEGKIDDTLECYTDLQEAIPLAGVNFNEPHNCSKYTNVVEKVQAAVCLPWGAVPFRR